MEGINYFSHGVSPCFNLLLISTEEH
ncbi:Nitrate-induced NOI protein [Zea mays]|uniref:Nitrate-induced NOI protein n=1 Tax=Zea mays TaxID=4577 RepID=A0A1D6DYY8_MAIZE|nr:Nitrate-induced NOI protein [Zea mays]